jgi:hypothetical protein
VFCSCQKGKVINCETVSGTLFSKQRFGRERIAKAAYHLLCDVRRREGGNSTIQYRRREEHFIDLPPALFPSIYPETAGD